MTQNNRQQTAPAPMKTILMPPQEMTDLATHINPYPWFQAMRANQPMRYDETRETWDFFLHEDHVKILTDNEHFSAVRFGPEFGTEKTIINMDPPRHGRLRSLVSKAFTPKSIQDIVPQMQALIDQLLADMAEKSEADLVAEFAMPLPMTVIALLLGVPLSDMQLFKRWSQVIVESPRSHDPAEIQALIGRKLATVQELKDYFDAQLATRRLHPQNDLMTSLLDAEVDGEKLDEEELQGFCILLLIAGNETTTNLIGNAVHLLTQQPELQARLRNEPELLPTFVEEVLRFAPPVVANSRLVKKEIEWKGQRLLPGQSVTCFIGAANRDEAVFADGETFQIDRNPNPHLTFGQSIHFCLGAPLARLETQMAIGALVQRLHHIELQPGAQLTPLLSHLVFGYYELPIR